MDTVNTKDLVGMTIPISISNTKIQAKIIAAYDVLDRAGFFVVFNDNLGTFLSYTKATELFENKQEEK